MARRVLADLSLRATAIADLSLPTVGTQGSTISWTSSDPEVLNGSQIGQPGGTISYASGVHGQAAAFDGSSGVRLPDGLISGSRYAVAMWVRPDQLTALSPTFFGARDQNNWVSVLPQGHDGVQGHSMVWSGTSWFDADTGTRLPAGEWSHLAVSNDDGHLVVWIDGRRVTDRTGFPDVFTTTNGTFSLGVNWWDAPFQGQLDDLRVYNTSLTDAQVTALAVR